MKRASWGLIFCNLSNKAIARNFGTIPAYLRQSSAASEFAGLALALEVAPRDTSLVVDCKAVDHVWHLPLQQPSQCCSDVLLLPLATLVIYFTNDENVHHSTGHEHVCNGPTKVTEPEEGQHTNIDQQPTARGKSRAKTHTETNGGRATKSHQHQRSIARRRHPTSHVSRRNRNRPGETHIKLILRHILGSSGKSIQWRDFCVT